MDETGERIINCLGLFGRLTFSDLERYAKIKFPELICGLTELISEGFVKDSRTVSGKNKYPAYRLTRRGRRYNHGVHINYTLRGLYDT